MSHDIKSAERPTPDHLLAAIADYVLGHEIRSELAYETAGYCLMDTLGLRLSGAEVSGVHQAVGSGRAGRHADGRRARSRHIV